MPPAVPASHPITLAIVEDDRVTREALVVLLAGEERFRCLGAFASAEEALPAIPRLAPDVALVDINLPGQSGIECVVQWKAQAPRVQALMLTAYEDSDKIFRALRAGANGYLLKKLIDVELFDSIEQVHAGGAPMSMPIARKVVQHFHAAPPPAAGPSLQHLTPREREILELLATGRLYKEIGDHLGISFSTVRAHLRNIYEKLHVQSRTEATVRFLQRG